MNTGRVFKLLKKILFFKKLLIGASIYLSIDYPLIVYLI